MHVLGGQAEQRELYKQLHQFRERAEHLEADLARRQQEFESARQAHSAMEALKISLEQSEQVNGALHESLRNLTQEVMLVMLGLRASGFGAFDRICFLCIHDEN